MARWELKVVPDTETLITHYASRKWAHAFKFCFQNSILSLIGHLRGTWHWFSGLNMCMNNAACKVIKLHYVSSQSWLPLILGFLTFGLCVLCVAVSGHREWLYMVKTSKENKYLWNRIFFNLRTRNCEPFAGFHKKIIKRKRSNWVSLNPSWLTINQRRKTCGFVKGIRGFV